MPAMPTVTYNGRTYKLRSRKTIVPDFDEMSTHDALIWLINNTWPTGYSKPNPLAGYGGTVQVR